MPANFTARAHSHSGIGVCNYAVAETYNSGSGSPTSLVIGDLNGDGRPDLAMANEVTDNVGVLSNSQAFAMLSPYGVLFDVQTAGFMAGQIVNGNSSAFDGLHRLQLAAADYAPAPQELNMHDDTRTLIIPAETIGDSATSTAHTLSYAATADAGSGIWAVTADVSILVDGPLSVTAVSSDAEGNTANASRTITKDTVAPTVTESVPATVGPTNALSLTFTVTFGEPVGNVHAEDFQLAKTGTADGTIASVTKDSGTGFTVTVSDVTGDGTLSLDLKSATDVQDTAGNAAEASSGGIAVTLDYTPPAAPAINWRRGRSLTTNSGASTASACARRTEPDCTRRSR